MMASFLFVVFTVVVYYFMKALYARLYTPLLVPIVTSTVVIVAVLLGLHISYETYMTGGKWIAELLGPAVVALAFPLYHHRHMLKQFFWPIFNAVFAGAVVGIASGGALAYLFRLDKKLILSLMPKSVTSPVAMDIASLLGGIPTLAVAYVMIAGIFGAMFGPFLLKVFKISHFLGVGIGLGAASHGIGTAKALEIGKQEAAISSIAMTLSAVFAALLCPVMLLFLQ
jgi:predicted murein hydrolase (TIGR00659 family)